MPVAMRTLPEDKFGKAKVGIASRQADPEEEIDKASEHDDRISESLEKVSEAIKALAVVAGKKPEPITIPTGIKEIESLRKDMLASLRSIESALKNQGATSEKSNAKITELLASVARDEKKHWKVTIIKRDSRGLIESFEINQK